MVLTALAPSLLGDATRSGHGSAVPTHLSSPDGLGRDTKGGHKAGDTLCMLQCLPVWGFAVVLGEGGTCGLGDHAQVGLVNAGVCSQSFIQSVSQSVCLSVCLCSVFCTWDRQGRCCVLPVAQQPGLGTREVVCDRGSGPQDRSRVTKQAPRGFHRPG